MSYFFADLVKEGTVHRIAYDTYDREIERYGEESIKTCESLFHIDSKNVFNLLSFFKKHDNANLRWLSGMVGIDDYFTAFRFEISEKLTLAIKIRDAFFNEFNQDNRLKYNLDRKYRENKDRIEEFFYLKNSSDNKIHNILYTRLQELTKEIDSLYIMKDFKKKSSNLLPSLAHMFINRLFFTNQREQEMVIYHFLVKYYLSQKKRAGRYKYPKGS